MKRLLITGFDPFGGEALNPSREAVTRLPDVIGPWTLCKREIPTVFGKAAEAVLAAAEECHPHAILCVGQAGGRAAVTPEVVAINLREASIPDNEGNRPVNCPVVEGGPAAYFSTLPVRERIARFKSFPADGLSKEAEAIKAEMSAALDALTAASSRESRPGLRR